MTRTILVAATVMGLVMAGGALPYLMAQPLEAEEHEEEGIEQLEAEIQASRLHLELQELDIAEMQLHIELLENMKETMFDPESCALIALGAITDDLDIELEQQITLLEQILEDTKSLGLRNAIRTALKDLYLEDERPEEALEILKEIIAENDEAIADWEEDEEEEGEEDVLRLE